MIPQFERTARLIGEDAQARLWTAKVAIFGLGGVGGYAAEALMRAGVGKLLLVDGDAVDETNINRQLLALHDTVGLPKAAVALRRAKQINPSCDVDARCAFYDEHTKPQFDLRGFDYVLDCIDSVQSKILLIEHARAEGVPIISCMGAGNKLDPSRFEVARIENTSVCPLARVMRRELSKRGIDGVKVVYSKEPPLKPAGDARMPSSISFVPGAAGLCMAGAVVRDLIQHS